MFCTGEAPTVPGISARFSRPGRPCSSVQAHGVVPVLAGADLDDGGPGPVVDHAAAGDLDLEHQRLARRRSARCCCRRRARTWARAPAPDRPAPRDVGFAAHAHQLARLGDDAEAVVRLQRDVVLHDHGRIVAQANCPGRSWECRLSTPSANRTWWKSERRGEHGQGDRHALRLQGHVGRHRDQGQGHHPVRRRRIPARAGRGHPDGQAGQAQRRRALPRQGRGRRRSAATRSSRSSRCAAASSPSRPRRSSA